jgi:uncharacterized membrane protein
MEIVRLLAGTIVLRPYVFVFLSVFLVLAVPTWGWRRTALYTVLGYAMAWSAEYSSIHNGFPFGLYTYIHEPTLDKELWIAGIPFMDSLSFVFLTFAGLQTARLALEPLECRRRRWDLRWAAAEQPIRWRTWALAGVLTMGLDIILDPVTLLGHRWFLGRIYYYNHAGLYAGVPLSNFAGWALLSWAITGVFLLLDRRFFRQRWGNWRSYPADALWGAGLFAGVLGFGLGVTFAIGEVALGITGCVWVIVMLGPILARVQRQRAQAPLDEDRVPALSGPGLRN